MRRGLWLVPLALAACAREPEPRLEAAYPNQPVQRIVGTDYAATPGLPLPPPRADGSIPPPPPRYLGRSTVAGSGNVMGAEVRRDAGFISPSLVP